MHIVRVYRSPSAPASWQDSFYAVANYKLCESWPVIMFEDFKFDLLKGGQFAINQDATLIWS